MTGVVMRVDLENVEAVKKALDPEKVEKALIRALDSAARKEKTQISKDVRSDYLIKAAEINKSVSIRKLKSGRNPARLIVWRGAAPGLHKFAPRLKKINTARGRRVGVTVQTRRSKPRSLVKGGFMANVHGNRILIRKGKTRYPVKRKHGPSVARMVQRTIGEENLSARISKNVVKEFHRQLELMINKKL